MCVCSERAPQKAAGEGAAGPERRADQGTDAVEFDVAIKIFQVV